MTKELEQLSSLVLNVLKYQCIFLTGNTQGHIKKVKFVGNRVEIQIAPPDYDLQELMENGVLLYLNNGKSYATQTNEKGTVFRPKKTRYWVNTDCVEACYVFANEIGAVVKNKLPTNPFWR